ncbi:MAG: hypothetical protein ABW168_04870 [Sedimenticola sp.]
MSWLKPFYENTEYYKQAVFAAKMNVAEKTVRRWENHETRRGIPFARIAELLKVDETVLRAAHTESLAEFDRCKQDEAINAKKQSVGVEVHLIQEAIEKIESEHFLTRLQASTRTDSPSAAATVLADLIKSEQIDSMRAKLDRAITDFRTEAGRNEDDINSLIALRGIYRVILRACAISPEADDDTDTGTPTRSYDVKGAKQSHPLIFSFDRAKGTKGYTRLAIANEHEIDDSFDTTLCIRLADLGGASDEERAHNCVKKIGKTIGLTSICPAFNEPNSKQRFKNYCGALNNALYGRKTNDKYIIARQDDPILSGVSAYLEEWLSHLDRFDCTDHQAGDCCNIMRGDPGGLGSWMAQGETAINIRLAELEHAPDSLAADDESGQPPSADEKGVPKKEVRTRIENWSGTIKKVSKDLKAIARDWTPIWSSDDDK